jgi:hypothetical protein
VPVFLFLVAHLVWLPRTLEDLDSVNFALGVRDFDVARHQPHPPGYPVFIALAKASTATLRVVGVDAAAPRGLAIWSAIGGALALPAIVLFFRRLEHRDAVAVWTMVVVAACPLFWFTALRPLSDMLGFAAAMWVLALAAGPTGGRALTGAALVAGLAIGIRSQTAVLTLPFLAYVAVTRRNLAAAPGAAGAVAAGALLWGVPLILASGGLSSYLHVLTFQAGADFEGVTMLWTHHTKRDILMALLNTFVWPWDWFAGIAVCVAAAAGAARIAWRAPRAAVALAMAFGPYAVFHLLFQETVTTRYAVPLVPVVAYAGAGEAGGRDRPRRLLAGRRGAGVGALRARRGADLPRVRRHGRDRARRRPRGRDRDARDRAAPGRMVGADPAGAGRVRAARP